MLYVQQNTELPAKEFIYNANANKFFSNYAKKHYDENSEKIKEQRKEHYDENSEKIKEQKKEHYDENSEKIKEQKKDHYDENSEKIKEQRKEHYDENSEKIKESMKKYKEKVIIKSTHKSGFDSVCISCCRLGNNTHPIKTEEEIEAKFPNAQRNLFFFMDDLKVNNQYRLCETCYRAFKEGRTPRLNMKTT